MKILIATIFKEERKMILYKMKDKMKIVIIQKKKKKLMIMMRMKINNNDQLTKLIFDIN